MRMQEINFHKNFQTLSEYFLKNNGNKKKCKTALTEIYFHVNTLRLENRELEENLSKWQDKFNKQINNNGNRVHIS
jgi:Mg2+ and Co2+ transporter CorA